jgi:hypothetical protein
MLVMQNIQGIPSGKQPMDIPIPLLSGLSCIAIRNAEIGQLHGQIWQSPNLAQSRREAQFSGTPIS